MATHRCFTAARGRVAVHHAALGSASSRTSGQRAHRAPSSCAPRQSQGSSRVRRGPPSRPGAPVERPSSTRQSRGCRGSGAPPGAPHPRGGSAPSWAGDCSQIGRCPQRFRDGMRAVSLLVLSFVFLSFLFLSFLFRSFLFRSFLFCSFLFFSCHFFVAFHCFPLKPSLFDFCFPL